MTAAKPMTAAELREKARLVREMGLRRAQEVIDDSEREAAEMERAANVIDRVQSGTPLPQDASYATIETMATATETSPAPLTFRRGAPLESDGPIATVAKKLGVPAAEIARRLNVNPITARNWDKRGKIPHLAIREALAKIASGGDADARPKKPRRS